MCIYGLFRRLMVRRSLGGLVLLFLALSPGAASLWAGGTSQKGAAQSPGAWETSRETGSSPGLNGAVPGAPRAGLDASILPAPEGAATGTEPTGTASAGVVTGGAAAEAATAAGRSGGSTAGGTAAATETAVPAAPPLQQNPGRAEQIMKALALAYPDRIGGAEFRDGDWAVPIRGIWYYYAEGRLLPQELRSNTAEYDPQPFYTYPAELPPWRDPTEEEAERIQTQARRRLQHPPKRSQHFHDALWRASSRSESWDRAKTLRFLGRQVTVHYSILEELALVEERILEESKTNAQVRQWINSLDVLDGWNWRSIADTQSRSFHAYGAALDLLPTSMGTLETYWAWTARNKSDWWTVPYNRRLHPPEAVIKAFESYGFVWGGKWMYYDTMHFEYRPEIFILSGLPLTTLR